MPDPTITARVNLDTSGYQRGVQQVAKSSGMLKKAGTISAGVLGGNIATAGLTRVKDFFTGAIKGALDADAANVRLARTMGNLGFAKQVAPANAFLSTLGKQSAMAKGELRPAFETLLRATKNYGSATRATTLAANISAGTGRDVATVAAAIGKAYQGSTTALRKLGVKVSEVIPNLGKVTAAQKRVRDAQIAYTQAVRDHGSASDEAKKAALKLSDAQDKLSEAQKATKKNALPLNVVLKDLAKTFGGQAAAKAGTAAGKMRNAQLQFKAFQITVGQALMPVLAQLVNMLTGLLPWLTRMTGWVKQNPTLFKVFAGVIVGVVVAIKAMHAATVVWAAAVKIAAAVQWLWNAAMSANPIMLVVIGIAALVAAVILAYQKVGWFRDLVNTVWKALVIAFNAIKNAAIVAFNWIKTNWPLLLAILTGPFGLAVLWVVRNWQSILDFFKSLPGKIAGFFSAVYEFLTKPFRDAASFLRTEWDAVYNFFKDLPGRLAGIGAGMFDFIKEAFKSAVNFVIRGWNAIEFKIPGFSLGPIHFGGFTLGLPDIPTLARGGITRSAGLAYLHPAEIVQPLSSQMARGGNTYYLHVEVPATANPAAVGRSIVDAIRSYETAAGTGWRRAPTGAA